MNDAKAIKKHAAQHDLFNRLHSIAADERFVRTVAEDWFSNRFAVLANQRCGSWYCDPATSSSQYAYFKSTDGHTNNWDFNLRRSNLSLATFAEQNGGFILVDSTRRGKRMPDGLSKTVPIWCCVVNRALERRWLAEGTAVPEGWDTAAYLPGQIVSPSERAQIEDRLDGWAAELEGSVLPLPELTKPLRPFFIHPATTVPPEIPPSPPYTPIICVSASRWVNETGRGDVIPTATRIGEGLFSRTVAFDYVPGAGDDDELWGRGLKPALYHAYKKDLLSAPHDDLASLVDELVSDGGLANDIERLNIGETGLWDGVTSVGSGFYLDLGPPVAAEQQKPQLRKGVVVRVVEVNKPPKDVPFILPLSTGDDGFQVFVFALPSARSKQKEFLHALAAVEAHLDTFPLGHEMDLIVSPGTTAELDAAVAWYRAGTDPQKDPKITLAPVSAMADPDLVSARKAILPLAVALLCSIPAINADIDVDLDKSAVADVLHNLIALWPSGNPPRAALKRVNEFLMSDERD